MNDLQLVLTLIGGVCGALFGQFDGFLKALIIFVCIDYFTGVLSAIYNKKLSSEIGAKGICKKVGIFCLVAVANIIDAYSLIVMVGRLVLDTAVQEMLQIWALQYTLKLNADIKLQRKTNKKHLINLTKRRYNYG